MDHVNISSRGWCGFYLGDQALLPGEVLYLFRKGLKCVYYQVCWCREVSENAYRVGLKIMDSGYVSVLNPVDCISLCRAKVRSRRHKQVDLDARSPVRGVI